MNTNSSQKINRKSSAGLIGAALGAVGAAIAIVMSKEENRRKVIKKIQEFRVNTKKQEEKVKEILEEKIEISQEKLQA